MLLNDMLISYRVQFSYCVLYENLTQNSGRPVACLTAGPNNAINIVMLCWLYSMSFNPLRYGEGVGAVRPPPLAWFFALYLKYL